MEGIVPDIARGRAIVCEKEGDGGGRGSSCDSLDLAASVTARRVARLQRRRRVIDVLDTRNDPFSSLFEPLLCYS